MLQIRDTSSIFVQNMLAANTKNYNKSLSMLASGYRINKASDDAAGLQISESLRSQIRGSQQADNNVQDAMNMLNTVDGSLSTITENLQRVRELAVQGANDTLGTDQRSAIKTEMTQLINDIDRIANGTSFNGKNILSSFTTFKVQVGAESTSSTNVLDLATNSAVGRLNASTLGIKAGTTPTVGASTNASALQSISKIDVALQRVNNRRSSVGAVSNRLQNASNNLKIQVENFSASEARVRNVDVAKESANLIKQQILQQASVNLLGQSNAQPSMALKLIGGN
ncbi:MAG: flagellin [Vampirovibrionales bacterium]